ncbi:hypothetical protein GO003_005055 [Methylicorpusculum oleiharenae]|uniref:hypothetical protein n=1 Tax=Methylicorpusculum oleiharenae TaxID=1338687 RepID=UPI001357DC6E|nr:hypothetical protein [Methylicorpusculum oleiharenae]MCD2449757.1 hypothetical protein [Methylicorpusculum oleiharenae]
MLAKEDLLEIERMVEQIIARQPDVKNNANVRYELDLRERTVRVEEELKHQRDLMIKGFDAMEKRFEQMEKRFEQVDKRFEQVDKRFEQVDKRFEQVDKRFELVDKRFEEMRKDMNTGFMEMNRRLDRLMYWTLGLVVSATLLVINFK